MPKKTETAMHTVMPSKRAIRASLGGEIEELARAFIWNHTPQGHDHWEAIYRRQKRLSKRSRQYLNRLLNS